MGNIGKVILLAKQKREKITIRHRRFEERKNQKVICDKCEKTFEWLTLEEVVQISGKNAEDIKQNLRSIRSKEK